VEIHTDLIVPVPKKSEVSPQTLLALAEDTLATRHSNTNLIYTDGSVLTDGRTGAGIFIPDLSASFPITFTSSTSILAAEMTAIIHALDYYKNKNDTPAAITIVTDSLSSLQALAGGRTDARPDLLEQIQIHIGRLAALGTRVSFQWIPSHVGLRGNEEADKAASAGARGGAYPRVGPPPSYTETRNKLRAAIWEDWEEEYGHLQNSRQWSDVGPPLKQNNKTMFHDYPISIQKIMIRMAINRHKTIYTSALCLCGSEPSFDHCLQCPNNNIIFASISQKLKDANISLLNRTAIQHLVKNNVKLLSEVACCIYQSQLGNVL
jgi:ribonuclease HI